MWKCVNCAEDVDQQLSVCWNCGADEQGALSSPSVEAEEERERKSFLNEKFRPKDCLRCGTELTHAGSKLFHEGMKLGALGDFAELFVARTKLEMYVCSRCFRVEFFVSEFGG
ncbi:MAG TPA: hypothetical protein VLB68_04295 [Pyrinomonadaceae bacterium]|nr:hypothetical protein [Pyrinomonadaceae bacterium]